MLKPWKDAPRGAQFQSHDGVFYKQTPAGEWKHHISLGFHIADGDWKHCDEPAQYVHKPTKLGQHRGKDQYLMHLVGGPWDGERAVLPRPEGSPMSLPVRIGDHYGRYNLDSGQWMTLAPAQYEKNKETNHE